MGLRSCNGGEVWISRGLSLKQEYHGVLKGSFVFGDLLSRMGISQGGSPELLQQRLKARGRQQDYQKNSGTRHRADPCLLRTCGTSGLARWLGHLRMPQGPCMV